MKMLLRVTVASFLSVSVLGACSAEEAPTKIGAGVFCEEFIKERIDRPADAEFNHTAYEGKEIEDGWNIVGNFDADRRRDFDCTVTYDAAEEQWTLQALTIDGVDVS